MTQIEPDNALGKIQQLLMALGKAYFERQQYSQALEKFQQFLEIDGEHSEAALQAALAAIALQDVSEPVLKLYEKAAALNPNSVALRNGLAELFSQFDVLGGDRANAIRKIIFPSDATGAAALPSPTPLKNFDRAELEKLWRRGEFEEALLRLREIENNNGGDVTIELALTHAYQAISQNQKIGDDQMVNLILDGLEQIAPDESLDRLRDYLTLRLALPEIIHSNVSENEDADEYQFILGLVAMEDYFSRLKNGARKERFILNKFDPNIEILNLLAQGDQCNQPLADCDRWQSVLVAEIQGAALQPQKIQELVSNLSNPPASVVRLIGGGFISLATDPLRQIECAQRLLKNITAHNRFSDDFQSTLNCGIVASSNSRKSGEVLHDCAAATHLLHVVEDPKFDKPNSSRLLLIADEQIHQQLRAANIRFEEKTYGALLPGDERKIAEVFWFNPLDYVDDDHPYKLSEFLLEKQLANHEHHAVFLGADRRLRRRLIIKIMPPQQAWPFLKEGDERQKMFDALGAIARLSHPNIATIFDLGVQDGMIYFVREFIEGQAITDIKIPEEDFDREMLELFLRIVRALLYARSHGLHHLNLKPSNIWVNEGRILKLTDFFCDNFTNRGQAHLSKYLAPEMAAGETGDERSDIFSLGVILDKTLAANGGVQNSRLKNEWEELIGKASHSEPAMRFPNLDELLATLRRIQAASLSQASDK